MAKLRCLIVSHVNEQGVRLRDKTYRIIQSDKKEKKKVFIPLDFILFFFRDRWYLPTPEPEPDRSYGVISCEVSSKSRGCFLSRWFFKAKQKMRDDTAAAKWKRCNNLVSGPVWLGTNGFYAINHILFFRRTLVPLRPFAGRLRKTTEGERERGTSRAARKGPKLCSISNQNHGSALAYKSTGLNSALFSSKYIATGVDFFSADTRQETRDETLKLHKCKKWDDKKKCPDPFGFPTSKSCKSV